MRRVNKLGCHVSGLQFRAEIFNLLNRTNFNTPNLIVFTPP
jgi:hypothetical protein